MQTVTCPEWYPCTHVVLTKAAGVRRELGRHLKQVSHECAAARAELDEVEVGGLAEALPSRDAP